MELRDRFLSESRQYGVYQIWKNYKLLASCFGRMEMYENTISRKDWRKDHFRIDIKVGDNE